MPGFDGTGPRGEGPMSGGGFGYCVLDLSAEQAGPKRGYGRGRSGAMGRRGFGRGWGRWTMQVGAFPGDEKAFLEMQLSRIEEEAARTKGRLEALEF